ncbi:hypothetical protein DSO57_1024759 [Entomophthora muscae]|uniref:Uncharacterized protein n=1 Tax=Entomophthora muscae TaxID=34485 RepID=A0ACC2RTF3_9FUNG|nr:hypothetical protein DSO57_1024759 [Entomophthora muscae]
MHPVLGLLRYIPYNLILNRIISGRWGPASGTLLAAPQNVNFMPANFVAPPSIPEDENWVTSQCPEFYAEDALMLSQVIYLGLLWLGLIVLLNPEVTIGKFTKKYLKPRWWLIINSMWIWVLFPSHPGPLGPAIVSQVNSPGLGPIRSLGTVGEDAHSLLVDHADLDKSIRSACSTNHIAGSPGCQWTSGIVQPWKLESTNQIAHPQDAMTQHMLYDPRDLAQTINSSGATCNCIHMASSEFSNLDEPITPDNAMEVDSANMLINNCNLTGPITPNNAMEVDSPNVLINKCNLNEPIKPLDTMETDTPNVLSNNCDSDGPIRPGATGAKFAHPDQAGCPTPGHPIRSRDAKKTNAPNLLHHYCNSAGPIRSGASNANYIHTDQADNQCTQFIAL